jgi:hypothetical protein
VSTPATEKARKVGTAGCQREQLGGGQRDDKRLHEQRCRRRVEAHMVATPGKRWLALVRMARRGERGRGEGCPHGQRGGDAGGRHEDR